MNRLSKTAATLLFATLSMSGCSTFSFKKQASIIQSASQSDTAYHSEAKVALQSEHFEEAVSALGALRTFYPASPYAEQALLDLIYASHRLGNDEAVSEQTAQFLALYPNSPYADYALYAQGVTYMQGSPKAGKIVALKQSERDTAYLRLAFEDFSQLVKRYPNSPYASDAVLRMTDIYNQFAHHEMVAAYWYVKQGAYLAAANRAKWVFQYYPRSLATPEAIAVLAYSYDKLGMSDTAVQYKNLLSLNYPQYLSGDRVLLPNVQTTYLQKTLNAISFGKLGRVKTLSHEQRPAQPDTVPQTIIEAQELLLP